MVEADDGEGKNNQQKLPIKYFPSPFSPSSPFTIHENCQQLYFIAYRMGNFLSLSLKAPLTVVAI